MGEEIHNGPSGLIVTRLAGPASEGADRRRWQFATLLPNGTATLTIAEVEDLVHALGESRIRRAGDREEPAA